MLPRGFPWLVPLSAVGFIGASISAGCGSSSDEATSPPAASSGAAGAAGSNVGGQAGAATGGKAGAGGKAAAGGQASGGAGAGGVGGKAGASGAGQAGAAGIAGAAGKAGTGGAGGAAGAAGAAGKAGAGGGATTCTKDADCTATLPPTKPAMCAVQKCDVAAKSCYFASRDFDGDGHPTNFCKALDDTVVVVGDDCDDNDKFAFPGAWDGPAGDGHTGSCDSIDNDCSGIADDAKLTDGTSCKCTPGDVKQCSETSTGQPIQWPTGKPTGACKYGGKTCLSNGTFGPCSDALGPVPESCNMLDDDCNGVVDDGPAPDNVPVDAVYFAYDGDGDQHGLAPGNGYALVHACTFNAPTKAPDACLAGPFTACSLGTTAAECCPANGWKFAASLVSDDCNDQNPKVNPIATDTCDGLDNNCDGTIDPGCSCQDGMTQACGSAAQCNAGGTQTCVGGVWGACSIPPALNAGADCGNGLGACAWPGSAKQTCTGPSTGATTCKYASNVGAGANAFQDHTYPGNDKWDWNCDGTDQKLVPTGSTNLYYGFYNASLKCNAANEEDICSPFLSLSLCTNPVRYLACYSAVMPVMTCNPFNITGCQAPNCGYTNMYQFHCKWGADNKCHGGGPSSQYTQECK